MQAVPSRASNPPTRTHCYSTVLSARLRGNSQICTLSSFICSTTPRDFPQLRVISTHVPLEFLSNMPPFTRLSPTQLFSCSLLVGWLVCPNTPKGCIVCRLELHPQNSRGYQHNTQHNNRQTSSVRVPVCSTDRTRGSQSTHTP